MHCKLITSTPWSSQTYLWTVLAECRTEAEDLRDDILSGTKEPYAFVGAPEGCDTLGCKHEFWGDMCR